MYHRTYEFGGVRVRIEAQEPYLESEKIREFITEAEQADCVIRVHAETAFPAHPDSAAAFDDRFIWMEEDQRCVLFCENARSTESVRPYAFVRQMQHSAEISFSAQKWKDLSSRVIFDLVPLIGWLAEFDAVILHASYIMTQDGQAILFTAPSGTGKSTQAELWHRYAGAEIINGDRVLLRMSDAGTQAHGIFYCGTSGICKNVSAPVRAIVSLGQAEENRLRRLRGREAFAALLPQCTYDTKDVHQAELVTASAAALAAAVPVYRLECLPEESAVVCLAAQLEEQ
ncbi:MAG: hypothetical protein MJ118_03550 [Clostridia bacterium]|nr:hypothetical protein [Clostridia bacterium]